jgi:flagellar biosynthesis protein FliP
MTSVRHFALACCLTLSWLAAFAAASESPNRESTANRASVTWSAEPSDGVEHAGAFDDHSATKPRTAATSMPPASPPLWLADWPATPAELALPTPAESVDIDSLGLGPLIHPFERKSDRRISESVERRDSQSDSQSDSDAETPRSPESRASLPTSSPWSGWVALSLLSLAPAALLMTTSYVRIAAVLGLLRQALGMPQLPSSTVISSLALFMTFLVMAPIWTEVYEEAIVPARDPARRMSWDEFWTKGSKPLRRFMSRQIDRADNSEDVWLFYRHLPESRTAPTPSTYDEVPLTALLPAFLLSELKIAFLIGFQICLPFLVVDLVVASMTTALGMMMVPTQAISLPMKLLLFVLLDGWRLVVGMLLESFQV